MPESLSPPNPQELLVEWERHGMHELRAAELKAARQLAEINRTRAWEVAGASSIGHYGERCGLGADKARMLAGVGRALIELPQMESKLRSGRIPLESAAIVGEVTSNPRLLRESDNWAGWAETESVKALRNRMKRRIEEDRSGPEPVVPIATYVRESARKGFKRANEIASAKASRKLSEGETLETLIDHYLNSFDPDRVTPGVRRVEDTATDSQAREGRYVPVSIQRELYDRQGHRCAVPFCDNSIFLEKAHIVAHASGGSREADNLILLCSRHHRMLDEGRLRLRGTASNPIFIDLQGRDIASRLGVDTDSPILGQIVGQILGPAPSDVEVDSSNGCAMGDPPLAGPPSTGASVESQTARRPENEPTPEHPAGTPPVDSAQASVPAAPEADAPNSAGKSSSGKRSSRAGPRAWKLNLVRYLN